jgi:hypothetical protein
VGQGGVRLDGKHSVLEGAAYAESSGDATDAVLTAGPHRDRGTQLVVSPDGEPVADAATSSCCGKAGVGSRADEVALWARG